MNKQEKSQEIDALTDALKKAPPVFVLEYRGLTVNQASALRKKVRGTSSRYRVVKNRLALRAVKGTPLEALAPHFEGPTAIAYTDKEAPALAKALDEFARDNPGIRIKAGWIDGRLIDAQAAKTIATLPSREVLVSRLMATLNAPLTRFVTVLNGPARGFVRVLDQIAKSKEAKKD